MVYGTEALKGNWIGELSTRHAPTRWTHELTKIVASVMHCDKKITADSPAWT